MISFRITPSRCTTTVTRALPSRLCKRLSPRRAYTLTQSGVGTRLAGQLDVGRDPRQERPAEVVVVDQRSGALQKVVGGDIGLAGAGIAAVDEDLSAEEVDLGRLDGAEEIRTAERCEDSS